MPTAPADRFHDADLFHLLLHDGANRIDDEKGAEEKRECAEGDEDEQHGLNLLIGVMPARVLLDVVAEVTTAGNLAVTRAGLFFDAVFDFVYNALDISAVVAVLFDDDAHLAVGLGEAEPLYRLQRHVGRAEVGEARWRRVQIVHGSGDAQIALLAVVEFDNECPTLLHVE